MMIETRLGRGRFSPRDTAGRKGYVQKFCEICGTEFYIRVSNNKNYVTCNSPHSMELHESTKSNYRKSARYKEYQRVYQREYQRDYRNKKKSE